MKKTDKKVMAFALTAAVGTAAFAAGATAAPVTGLTELKRGYMLSDMVAENHGDKATEHKCGEGKCGEGKCGEGKCGEKR